MKLFLKRGNRTPAAKFTIVFSSPPRRCVYVGDTDARCEALSRREEQWCDWSHWERGEVAHASELPSHPLQPHDQVLGLRPQPAAPLHWAQSSAQVGWGAGLGRGRGRGGQASTASPWQVLLSVRQTCFLGKRNYFFMDLYLFIHC